MIFELRHFDDVLLRFSATEDTSIPEIELLWVNDDKRELMPLDLSLDEEGMVKAVQAYLRILDKLPQQNEQMPFAFSVLFRLSSFVITMTIRYNSEINDFEYVYTTEGTPSKEASIVHISFEVRDRLNDNAIASPEANILICTGITNRSCEPYAKELLAYLEDPQNPFRHV